MLPDTRPVPAPIAPIEGKRLDPIIANIREASDNFTLLRYPPEVQP